MDPLDDIFPIPISRRGPAGKFQPKARPGIRKGLSSTGPSTLPIQEKGKETSVTLDRVKLSENVASLNDSSAGLMASSLAPPNISGNKGPYRHTVSSVDHVASMSTSSEFVALQPNVGMPNSLPSGITMLNGNIEEATDLGELTLENAGLFSGLESLDDPTCESANRTEHKAGKSNNDVDMDVHQGRDFPSSHEDKAFSSPTIGILLSGDMGDSNDKAITSDAAQPHSVPGYPANETQQMEMARQYAPSVGLNSDMDRLGIEEAEIHPDLHTVDDSQETITTLSPGLCRSKCLSKTQEKIQGENPISSITHSEVEPGHQHPQLVQSETNDGSNPALLPDDICDYSSFWLDEGTSGDIDSQLPYSKTSANLSDALDSDTLISGRTAAVPHVPGELSLENEETYAEPDIRSRQDKSSMSNSMKEGPKSSRQLRKRVSACQLVDESDGEARDDQTHDDDGDEAFDADELREGSSSKKSIPRKSKGAVAKKQKQERKKEGADVASEKSTRRRTKKFSHSTQKRVKRSVDKALLDTPWDDIDHRNLCMKDLIRLAEQKEKLANKRAKPSSTLSSSQSADKSTPEDTSHKEGTSYAFEQGTESMTPASSSFQEAPTLFNYQSFMEKTPRTRWSKQDTELFYEGIRTFGTDLSMIKELFPNLTRNQVKLKFKKEERENRLRLSEALASRVKDHSHFELVIERLRVAPQTGKESSMDVSAGMTAEEEDGESSPETNEGAKKSERDDEEENHERDDDEENCHAKFQDPLKTNEEDDNDLFNGLGAYESEL